MHCIAQFNYCQFLRTKWVVASCWKNYSVFQKRQSKSDKKSYKIHKNKSKDRQHNFQRKNDNKKKYYTEKEPH